MANLNLIRMLNIPYFQNVNELSAVSNIDEQTISKLTVRNHRFYKSASIQKKSGGYRTIQMPSSDMKALQAWVLRNILEKLEPSEYATAFRKGVGLMANVAPHAANRFFMSLDIKNFFSAIKANKVNSIFKTIGYGPEATWLLTRICTFKEEIPQGGVTSPHLSNLVCSRLDRRIGGYTRKKNIIFTRYCDDMTFSSGNPHSLQNSFSLIKHIIEQEGFELNDKKTRFSGPYRQTKITGLVKNSSEPKFNIGRRKRKELRAMIHSHLFKTETLISEEQICGQLNFVKSIDLRTYETLKTYYYKLKSKQTTQS